MSRRILSALAALLALVGIAQAAPAAVDPAARGIAVQALGKQRAPAGYAWNFSAHPISIYRAPIGRYWTDLNPRAATPAIAAIFAGVAAGTTGVVYADASAANNSGAATSPATATQGIRASDLTCENNAAYTTGCLVYVKAGEYTRNTGLMNNNTVQSGGKFALAKPTAIVCYGGPCILSESQPGLSWTANGTYPSVYQASRSAVAQDMDKIAKDSNGDPVIFATQTSIANVAACSNQDCRYNDGSIEYVKRADGAVPSDANTRVVLANQDVMRLPATGGNAFYVSGMTVYGGNFGTFQDTDAPVHSRDIVLQDSTFGLPAWGVPTIGNVISIDNLTGFVGLYRTTATYAGADLYNAHANSGGVQDWLLYDTVARNAGYGTGSQSNNCVTAHDGGPGNIAIRMTLINGTCTNAAGGPVRTVGYDQVWALNYTVDTDRGDIAAGGAIVSDCFDSEGNSTFWLQDSRCARTINSLEATSTGTIYYRNFDDGGGQRAGAGTIAPF